MILHSSSSFMVSTSSQGNLFVWDLRKNNGAANDKKRYAISEDKNQELNCCLFRNGDKNIVTGGGAKGLGVWNWDLFSEEIWTMECGPEGTDCLVANDGGNKGKGKNQIFYAAGEDGFIRACEIFSSGNGISRVFARHAEDVDYAVPIVSMDVSHCGNFLATSGHDMSISFFDISEVYSLAKDADFGVEYQALKKKEEVEDNDENWDDQEAGEDEEGSGELEEDEEDEDGMVQERKAKSRIEKYKDVDGISSNDPKKEKKMIEKMQRKDFFDGF